MASVDDLRPISILRNLNEDMLKAIAQKASLIQVKAGEYIFREGEPANKLYSLLEGKIGLEVDQNTSTAIHVKDIQPTRSFGISSLVDEGQRKTTSHAKAIKDSRVLVWQAKDLDDLFEKDYQLGFLFMIRVGRALKERLFTARADLANRIL